MNLLSRLLRPLRQERVLSPIEVLPVIPLEKILSFLDENDFFHLKVTSRRMWESIEKTKMNIPRRIIDYLCISTRAINLRRFSHAICIFRAHSGKKTVEWILTHSGLLTIRQSNNLRKKKSRLYLTSDEKDFDFILNRIVNNSIVLGLEMRRDDLEFVLEYDNEVVEAHRVIRIIDNAERRII